MGSAVTVQISAKENAQMFGLKAAFDPQGMLNPCKVIPTLNRCAACGKCGCAAGRSSTRIWRSFEIHAGPSGLFL